MRQQYPHFESKVNHKLAAEVRFPQREGHGDPVPPLRQIGEESSAAPLVLFSIISAFPLSLPGPLAYIFRAVDGLLWKKCHLQGCSLENAPTDFNDT